MNLTKEEITGEITGIPDPTSNAATESILEYDAAKEALAKADSAELFALYEKAIARRNQIWTTLNLVIKHYTGSSEDPRLTEPETESESSILAIKEVALASIAFAREVVGKSHG